MNNFNKTRFFNFGKYDYVINKSFYRNMLLIAVFGSIGISFICFLVRWAICHPVISLNGGISSMSASDLEQLGELNPASITGTCLFLLGFSSIMMVIYAGYTFHNLRTKQGRIIELTIPATNIERWIWHILVSFFGGLIVCIAGILCADAINLILNLIIYQGHVNSSLTAGVWDIISFASSGSANSFNVNGAITSMDNEGITGYLICLMITSLICKCAIYVFGNSIKYHYNIILTYIAENVISFALSVIFILFIITMAKNSDPVPAVDGVVVVKTFLAVTTIILAIIAVLCYWGSYRMYCKAQITSKWNI